MASPRPPIASPHIVPYSCLTSRCSDRIESALVASGLPAAAINLVAVPSKLGLLDDVIHAGRQVRLGTYFEVLARLFRFDNQSEGDAYLHSHPPVYYLRGTHDEESLLPASLAPGYSSRAHAESVDESPLAAAFAQYGDAILARISQASFGEQGQQASLLSASSFAPLRIMGLECLEQRTKCLGDGPDAAYFAPNVHEDKDEMELFQLRGDDVRRRRPNQEETHREALSRLFLWRRSGEPQSHYGPLDSCLGRSCMW